MSDSRSDMSSEELDSSCGESSSEWDDSRGPSPRDSGAPPPPARTAPAGLRIPPLALRANLEALPRDGGAGGQSAPATARQPSAVPRLALPGGGEGAAARGTPGAAAPLPPPPKRDMQQQPGEQQQQQLVGQQPLLQQGAPPPPQHAGHAGQLSLDILSPALTLSLEQGSAAAAQRCAAQLGVVVARLRFYALTEVAAPEQLPAGCARAAVEVEGSTFSLAELEKLVAENQQLKDAAASAAAAAAEASAAQQAAGAPAATEAADVRALQAQLRALQADKEALQQQLRQSESLRRKGKKALAELKQEFDALSRELMLGQASVLGFAKRPAGLALPAHSGGAPPALGTPVALSGALQL